ncbi:hypothetical protein F0562_003470 [Nyssa sinensis]|uniref:NAC domain-containing protein n=1 Tax=Nyssa sinensis TaxID=561372 RepID=A0A5J5C0U5_9ASTE|nr:hypothetical protein F0562_003470 [Nyssa sinensis]
MHEYRLANVDRSAGKKNNLRLDDWVLCRIYNKKGTIEKPYPSERKSTKFTEIEERKPEIMAMAAAPIQMRMGMAMLPPPPPPPPSLPTQLMDDFFHFETSDSIPRLHTDSSSSEQVVSPEFEVQSEPKWDDFEKALDFQFNYNNAFPDDPFVHQVQFPEDQVSPLQDVFMYTHKPF